MAKTRSISPLFNPSGCLTLTAIHHHLEGSLPGEDQQRVMDHLDACMFCRDAVEGLAKGKNIRGTEREIASLNRQILEQASGSPAVRHHPSVRKIPVRRIWTYAAAAASVILLAGIYFLLRQPRYEYTESMIALSDTIRKEKDQPLHDAQTAVPDVRKAATQENPRAAVQPPAGPELSESEPEIVNIEEEAEVQTDGLISSMEARSLADSSVPVREAEQPVVVEMKEIAADEPPSVVEGLAVGGVSAGKEKSALRMINASRQMAKGEEIFTVAEHWPEFPGGQDSLNAFLRRNLRYPEQALAGKTEGIVYLSFVVETDGSLSDIKVLRGFSPECDQEAIRLVSSMPPWIPGQQRSVPVRVYYTLPIPFLLPK